MWAWSDLSNADDNLNAYRCPPGYCSCSRKTSFGANECHYVYNNSDPNLQCRCDREGQALSVHLTITLLYDVQASYVAVVRMGRELVSSSTDVSIVTMDLEH